MKHHHNKKKNVKKKKKSRYLYDMTYPLGEDAPSSHMSDRCKE